MWISSVDKISRILWIKLLLSEFNVDFYFLKKTSQYQFIDKTRIVINIVDNLCG